MARIKPVLLKIKGVSEAEIHAALTELDVRQLMADVKALFRIVMHDARIDDGVVRQMMTKFHDAGRRSPPWQPGSSKGVFRRPQDGEDGNRQKRWLFESDHEFYASEIVGTLVEVKYYFQALSMEGAPRLPSDALRDAAIPLLGHPLQPGAFLDPLMKTPIKLQDFITDRRTVESGHIIPLSRTVNGQRGRHDVTNSTLMLRDSNRIQTDKTIPELLDMFAAVLQRHGISQDQSTGMTNAPTGKGRPTVRPK